VRSYSYKTVFAIVAIFEALSFVRIQNEVFLAVLVDPFVGGKESVLRHILSCFIFLAWFVGTSVLCWVIRHEPNDLFAATGILSHISAFVLVEAYADAQVKIAEDLKAKYGMKPVYALYCVAPVVTAFVFFFLRYQMKRFRRKYARANSPTRPSRRSLMQRGDGAPRESKRLASEGLDAPAEGDQRKSNDPDDQEVKPLGKAAVSFADGGPSGASSAKETSLRPDEPLGSDKELPSEAYESSDDPATPRPGDRLKRTAACADTLRRSIALLKEPQGADMSAATAIRSAMLHKSQDIVAAGAREDLLGMKSLERWIKEAGVCHYTERQAYEHWMLEVDESENQTSASVAGFLICRACYCLSAGRIPPVDCEQDPVVGCNEYSNTYWKMCACMLSLYLLAVGVVQTLREYMDE